MADPITWYLLPKKIDDLTTIEEEIDAKILQHNLDPSAHGQDNEAIYMHRISEVLDHANYSIYNIKLHPESRPIKAFVDAGGAAEFTTIQEAIDYVNALGGGKIFIKAGTYYLDSDINLYSNIYIEGEDRDTVILDFQYTTAAIHAHGTSTNRLHNIKIDNIQITHSYADFRGYIEFRYVDDADIINCKFLTNKDPIFANLAYIEINNCTQINIKNNYFKLSAGPTITGESKNIYVEDNFFTQSDAGTIDAQNATHVSIAGNYFEDAYDDLVFINGENCIIEGNYFKNIQAIALLIYGSNNIIANNIFLGTQGIYFENQTGKCIVIGNRLINNQYEAIEIYSGEGYVIANNLIDSGEAGIYIHSGVSRSIITGNYLRGATNPLVNNGTDIEIGHNII